MNARVFFEDGAWYWAETDADHQPVGEEITGPFTSAIQAGADARKAIVAAAKRQEIVFETQQSGAAE